MYNLFLDAVKDFVPSKILKGRNPVSWIDSIILNLIKKKNSVRQKLKSHTNAGLAGKFKSLWAQVKKLLRESRDHFYDSSDTGLRFNPKRLWSLLKLNSKSRPIPGLVPMATAPDSSADQSQNPSRVRADTPVGIAELFNKFFASVFTIDCAFEMTACTRSDTIIFDLTLNEPTVLATLKALEVGKATGPDEIPAKLLKETASAIAPSLCKIFNKSLQLGSFPSDWKLANVVPVHKKRAKDHVENYRPISLLPIVSKVFERCVLKGITDQLYQVISPKQHGFCTGRSCVTNLLEALDHIGSLLDSGSQVDTIYLDKSKAFDKVSHWRLVHKLMQAGFGGNLLNWFCSYLSSRRQCVTVLGATLEDLLVTSGVPQGSILGPALFLLYVNDLPEVISSSSRVLMFADDTKIFREIKTLGDASSLQEDLGKLAT